MYSSDFKERHNIFIWSLLIIFFILFLIVVQDYIVSIVLAFVFSILLYPFKNRLSDKLGGRDSLASTIIVLVFLLCFIMPSILILDQILSQAMEISDTVIPVLEKQVENTNINGTKELPHWFPFRDKLMPYSTQITEKITELIGNASSIFVKAVGSLTQGTFLFFINFFIMLYAIYFFLIDGKKMLNKIPDYLPIKKSEVDLIVNEVKTISRATLKGAFLISIIQGTLVGIGFWFVGISGSVFWGSVAAFVSLIPSVGAGLIYVPAGLYLILNGHNASGFSLLIWGFGIVSSVDNVLRPYLVGKDMKIPEILILVSTLGGITMFGLAGIVLGPVITGLTIALLKIYKKTS